MSLRDAGDSTHNVRERIKDALAATFNGCHRDSQHPASSTFLRAKQNPNCFRNWGFGI
ncbi:hypothetical protein [Pseudomonas fluorescens]|uniref:hypothetical protein n=1 Tax=Pseudomonas fluorescens TaxID=294 RepID=UPI002B1E7275|nr:hypothetical protein [Pseudomonas fluorescens]